MVHANLVKPCNTAISCGRAPAFVAFVGRIGHAESHCWDELPHDLVFRCPDGRVPQPGPDTRGRPPDIPRTG
jgi:hypothetical protein